LNRSSLPIGLGASLVNGRFPDHDVMLKQLNPGQSAEFKRLSDRIFHRSLDECHGRCLFRKSEIASEVANSILHFDGVRYDLDRFVIMPNHVHAIVQFRTGFDLTVVGQSWMRYSARTVNQLLNESGALWQPEPFDHIIRIDRQFEYLQQYILDNPSKANVKESEFLYWQRE
jgi:putative transposase